ncbi:MAG: GNAT family protein [Anaerolineae bacterium]
MLGPYIHEGELTLGPIGPEHLENYCLWFADQEVTRYLLVNLPPAAKQEQEWFDRMTASDRTVYWGIFVDGVHVGGTSLESINWQQRHGASGTIIGDKRYWHRGVGSATMRLRTHYGFHQLGFEKLKSSAFAENTGSRRSLEKAGYQQSGIERREIFREGRWHDIILYELLREDWLRVRSNG